MSSNEGGGSEQDLTRREMLQGSAAVGLAWALRPVAAQAQVSHGAGPVVRVDLGGSGWTLRQESEKQSLPVHVPGSTYTALLAAQKIPDPFFAENNGAVQWVAEKSWLFERTFEVPLLLGKLRHMELVCEGLDTLATVWLNGQKLGAGNNMFRTWRFDLRSHLRRGANHLQIRFEPLSGYVAQQRAAYRQQHGVDLPNDRSWVRKGPYMWGWDWCRPILTQGIWKGIAIVAYDRRIADLNVTQAKQPDGSVQLEIEAEIAGEAADTTVEAEVLLADSLIGNAQGAVSAGRAVLRVRVPHPQLWWPNGMGDQPLYQVTLRAKDTAGNTLDTASRRVGLRTVAVVPPAGGVALHLRVNGVPVFAKGADWIPADNMPTRVTPELLRWYMERAVACNFNFIRLWGGGYYEEDVLFDVCDELGLMLQFEFKFANTSYPVKDQAWMDNLRQEIEEQTRRCRTHPSIVIWSGNNEIENFDGYDELFDTFIGGIVRRLVPGAFYEVGSGAHGSGDIHSWEVWHGNQPVEYYDKIEGFVTEFGMQSTPVPATVRAFTDTAGRKDVNSAEMQYHELDGSGKGIELILDYTRQNFGELPSAFDDSLWLTCVNQAWMVRYAVEHWRRDMPRSMAAVIWQYNDCWPCSSWSMVDSMRREKPLLYQSKHFFAPLLVSGVFDAVQGKASLFISSDMQSPQAVSLQWTVTDTSGAPLQQGTTAVTIEARTSVLVESLPLASLVQAHGAGSLLVWMEVSAGDEVLARNTLLLGRPVALRLKQPQFVVSASGGETEYTVRVTSSVPALWTWIEVEGMDAILSDNSVDLRPGIAWEATVVLPQPLDPFVFRERLRVRSVYDVAPQLRG